MSDAPAVADLKSTLASGRRRIETLHRDGALGTQVVAALTDLCDRVVLRAFREALERVPADVRSRVPRELALVAVGGYGRGDQSPYSDVDLLFLLHPRAHRAVRDLVSGLVRDLWDVGLKLGHSVRTPADCAAFARKDLPSRTAMTEARLLEGSPALFADLQRRMHDLMASTSINRFVDAALAERAKEHQDYFAATVYLLEPNVKKSPGGLRDLHLLRWTGLMRYGTNDPEMLRASGLLAAEDARTLGDAAEFLYRIRNEMHFQAAAPQDVLTREEQTRLAAWLKYETEGPVLGVERFMQAYYRHTTALHDVVLRFADGARHGTRLRSFVNRLLTSRTGEHFLVNRDQVTLDPDAGDAVAGDAETALDLFDLARRHDAPVAHETLKRILAAGAARPVSETARRRFLEILADPAGLGGLLRNLHRAGLLGRLLPPFEQIRCLIQFNRYHKYTVDEHSLLAVEAATRRLADPGPLGQAYRDVHRKDLLHLALLLHDAGKGRGENHSEIGARLADDVAVQFRLDDPERKTLVFLVRHHLLMAHTAFRRDVSDVHTLVQFARRVGTPEALRMLTAVTAADTEAVGPGSWSAWKESLLAELYARALQELTGEAPVADEAARVEAVRAALRGDLRDKLPAEWLDAQLAASTPAYLITTDRPRIARHLFALHALGPSGVRVESVYGPATGLCEYTVVTRDDLTPGIFSKIAGVLAAGGFQIVDARIVTRPDGVVIDTFQALDLDYTGEPPEHRRREVADLIEEVLLGRRKVEDLFARRGPHPARAPASSGGPVEIAFDNDSSERFTIVEVFADDRQGLLYAITRTLFDLGLSVSSAKISTRLDQAVDAFYVTDRAGGKIVDPARLDDIRRSLTNAIK